MAGNSNRREGKPVMVPKTEDLGYELPPYTSFSGDVGVCCSSLNIYTIHILSFRCCQSYLGMNVLSLCPQFFTILCYSCYTKPYSFLILSLIHLNNYMNFGKYYTMPSSTDFFFSFQETIPCKSLNYLVQA